MVTKYQVNRELSKQLGRKEFKYAFTPTVLRDPFYVYNVCSYIDLCLWPLDASRNPLYGVPVYSRFIGAGCFLELDMINNNVFPVEVTFYELRPKHVAYRPYNLIDRPLPDGLGSTSYDMNAEPDDSALFSRYYDIVRRRSTVLYSGNSYKYRYNVEGHGSNMSTIGRYMWYFTPTVDRYLPLFHEPVFVKLRPYYQTSATWADPLAGPDDYAKVGATLMQYFGVQAVYNYVYYNSEPVTADIVYDTSGRDNISASAMFSRAPGSLDRKSNFPNDDVDKVPVVSVVIAEEEGEGDVEE